MKRFLTNFCSIVYDIFTVVYTTFIINIVLFSILIEELVLFNNYWQLVLSIIFDIQLLLYMVEKDKRLWMY